MRIVTTSGGDASKAQLSIVYAKAARILKRKVHVAWLSVSCDRPIFTKEFLAIGRLHKNGRRRVFREVLRNHQ
jgi:hypothetical protein